MSIPRSVAQILDDHVTLTVDSIDRMYLSAYVPHLQYASGVVTFFCRHRGHAVASSSLMDPMTRQFVAATERYAEQHHIPLITFEKGQRKDDVMAEHLRHFDQPEGVVLIGKAQEKANIYRTQKRHNAHGQPYPWIVPSTGLVNHYYFYCVDADFGPFFLKFCSYFPYPAKLCINGHDYAKCQIGKEGIAFGALDNGFAHCADPARLQALCDQLSPQAIEALFRRWLQRLPHPFQPADREAGYRYELSIRQAEFARTQILDRPLTGRVLFEEIIRENLDLGRPDQMQFIFQRRINRATPGQFRTRIVTEGVFPSLHCDYKSTRIKQYYKQVPGVPQVAIRTETTINRARDFGLGTRLCNLPALRQIGFPANRRILEVEHLSHDCALAEATLQQLQRPLSVAGQRVSALRPTDPRVLLLWHFLVGFRLLPFGFTARDLREQLAAFTHQLPATMTQGKLSYELRRLRLRGIIERIPRRHRYRVTPFGFQIALFFTRVHARLYRPLAVFPPDHSPPPASSLARQFHKLDQEIDRFIQGANLAA
jgi:hypothetical protein